MMDAIERVARAIALADLGDIPVDMDAHMRHVREHYSELARAAIEAMREPTDEMLDYGEWAGGENGVGRGSALAVWGEMITAALNPQTAK
jgi:hypothetical protein